MNRKGTVSFVTYIIVYTLFCFSSASAAPHTLSLTSSGSQSIDVAATAITAISSDSINVATTCRYGYNFTLSTSVSNNNLYLNGDISNNTSGTYFSPVDGTTALNAATNTWGYYYNSNASTTPSSTSIFSPVPTLSSPATIKTPLTTPASSNINDNFKIYYGVNSAPSMSVGTYKMIPDTNNSNNDGTLVYTATIADSCMRYTVHFSPTSIFEGNTLSGTGTMSDQSIYEGIATPLTTNGFTAPSGYYFIGWNTAQDGSGTSYTNGQSVTDLTAAGNTITLYAQWTDCPPNNICYTANGSGVSGEMGNQTISNTNTSAVLYAPNYKRSNYGFAAWNTKADGTGTNYGPQETIDFTAGAYNTSGLRLYAKWVASTSNMQNWTGCSSMNIGDVTALKDTRDNDVYAVAKLADGKCWMIENLRLDGSITLTSSNTHNPSLPLTNSWWYSSANDNNTKPTSNHLSAAVDPATTAWCHTDSSNCDDQSMLATNNTTLFTNNTASSYSASNNVYSYGNYYNWYSATAGYGKYGSSYGNGYHAPGDICPTGWHMPKGGDKNNESSNEYWSLIVTGINNGTNPANYDSNTVIPYYTGTPEGVNASNALRSYPNNFIYSGSALNSNISYRNTHGDYWSASGINLIYAYNLSIYKTSVYPGTYNYYKYTGYPVRCIAGN